MLLRAQIPKQLAAQLRGQRQGLRLTQKQAASLVGLLPKTISALESSPERCSVRSLFKLLSALGLEMTLRPKAISLSADTLVEW